MDIAIPLFRTFFHAMNKIQNDLHKRRKYYFFFFLQPTKALGFLILYRTAQYNVICRPLDHSMGRLPR